MGKQPEPVSISSERDVLMAQVEESTAGLCKEISHLTVHTQQQLASIDKEGEQKERKVNEALFFQFSGCPLLIKSMTLQDLSFHVLEESYIKQLWFWYHTLKKQNPEMLLLVLPVFPQMFNYSRNIRNTSFILEIPLISTSPPAMLCFSYFNLYC